jgi:polysaccharide export outer membrane protein
MCLYMAEPTGNFRGAGARDITRNESMIGSRMNSVGRSKAIARASIGALALAAALGGCAYGGYERADIPPPSAEFFAEPDQLFVTNREHRLGPSDVVGVAVYRAPEFSGDYRVDAAGKIMMPLLGLVSVQGMTTTEMANDLHNRLSDRYYVNPDVSVTLKESNSQQITVDGSVGNPGQYSLVGRTTLMQAIARAGGVGPNSNLRRVVIFRTIEGQRMVAAFDLAAIREAQADDPELFAQDIIIVDGSESRQALRDFFMTLPLIGLFRPFIY